MILQALNEYYERKSAGGELAPDGFEWKEIPFVIVLEADGRLVQIDDTRRTEGKKKIARTFLVPQTVKRSAGVAANLLWDTPEYVLGVAREGGNAERVAEQHAAFRARLDELGQGVDAGLDAVNAFLDTLDIALLSADPLWSELVTNPFISFRLSADTPGRLICQRPAVIGAIRSNVAAEPKKKGFCLVRGEEDAITRLHPAIKGVWGAQTAGANIVSFNLDAFNSFGKTQNYNAPIGERAAFAYTTALNHLLRRDSPQRMQVGDASAVFWAADIRDSQFQTDFAALFGEHPKDNPDGSTQAVRNLYRATASGVYNESDAEARFCVLGLAPNAARIAPRFWYVSSVRELALHIRQHFDDLDLVKPAFESPYLSQYRLLGSIALQGKTENVPPNLAGDAMRAILAGTPYPAALLQAALRRIRAEQTVNYPRAAILKASLNRLIRHQRLDAKELSVGLDKSNNDPGYRLGRMFAVLERIQSIAQPGINATIRERYYGAASTSPASVLPLLVKLKNHHLAKFDSPGLALWYEKLLGEIVDGLSRAPARLNLSEQSMFAIGYYHQQQDFYAPKNGTEAVAATDTPIQGETA